MAVEGVDFSWARPGGAALARAGKRFVVRYVPYMLGDGTWTRKGLSAAEIKDYRARGLAIALVFESTAARPRGGYSAGVADAKTSQAGLSRLAKTGIPQDLPVYFAVDFNTTSADWPALDAYLRGAAAVLGAPRIGVYAEKSYIDHARSKKLARYLWQTYAWSGGRDAAGIHIKQYLNGQIINGGAVDLCRAFQDDFGQWPAEEDTVPITTYTPGHSARIRPKVQLFAPYFAPPLPDTSTEGADMPPLTSYVPGQTATIKATANIRSAPKIVAGNVLRAVPAGATETWLVIGWCKGSVDPNGGSDQWLIRWGGAAYEYTAKSNVTKIVDATPLSQAQADAQVKAATTSLETRITTIKGKVAANAADVAND